MTEEHKQIKRQIGKVFNDIAKGIETGDFGEKVTVGLTTLGSEHGVENLVKGAEQAAKSGKFDVVLIGPKVNTDLEVVEATEEATMHNIMEELLASKKIQACVTMHYNFPIGVSTVGKVITPGKGKEMYLATTTGTSAPDRTEAMVRNAIHGMIAAKASGVQKPKVGILNVDGARQVEKALNKLVENGYDMEFSESMRADGGVVMRGNDLLAGSPDVMVQDTLTGNIFMKIFSSFHTGGDYEALGYGYGPGIGEGYDKNILILSRASGTPVVAKALEYAADLVNGRLEERVKEEYDKANKAGLKEILNSLTKATKKSDDEEEVKQPPKEVVTGSLSGIDIMELEDAVQELWKNNIYAESGMGCTGPVVMVSEKNLKKAIEILRAADYAVGEPEDC
ncbi:glycine/sarcosine/betaine reductase complex component C subunit alpha [Isachenkonia alkalipeptolytica]|uniref:Glycine reductase n=1 Tax=Isachenkonia alkalipeptolytica TaxID=2565777 RepID=A0AA44BG81_9CLOT|nr:glycine reductase [Isachenkonia alkalipeptolytica]